MKTSALLFNFFLFTAIGVAQNSRIAGRVIDSATSQPLPYAHIMFENYRLGTSTDEQGLFAFNVADSLKNEMLIFTHVGYEQELLKISDLEKQRLVPMNALTEGLGEVMITPVQDNRSFTYRPDWRLETVGIGNMNAALYPSTIARYYPKPEKFDAAAFIKGLEKLGIIKQIIDYKFYSSLGADVPVCLYGKNSLVKGIGEKISRQEFPKYFFLVVKPKVNFSTKQMYEKLSKYLQNDNEINKNYTSKINDEDYGNDFEKGNPRDPLGSL